MTADYEKAVSELEAIIHGRDVHFLGFGTGGRTIVVWILDDSASDQIPAEVNGVTVVARRISEDARKLLMERGDYKTFQAEMMTHSKDAEDV